MISTKGARRIRTLGLVFLAFGGMMALMNIDCLGEAPEFFEEFPAWNMPDLAIERVVVEPESSQPGKEITIQTRIANVGTGKATPASLVIRVNGIEIGRTEIQALGPASKVEQTIRWSAAKPGRSLVDARIEIPAGAFDASADNNIGSSILRVSGETRPFPEVFFSMIQDSLTQPGNEVRNIEIKIQNPSFVNIQRLPVKFFLDRNTLNPAEGIRPALNLRPGKEQSFRLVLPDLPPGEHLLTVKLDPPTGFPVRWLQQVRSWPIYVPNKATLYSVSERRKWVSIGPRILPKAQPDWSVGRIDTVAFTPKNINILYVGAPEGGIWKSVNRGDSWTPLGDKLPSPRAKSIAVDPLDPNVIYMGTGSSVYSGGLGIFKSIDGGLNWSLFANKAVAADNTQAQIEGVSRLIVRRAAAGSVLVYAATNAGALRYQSNNPIAESSLPSDWVRIKSGIVTDLAVNPTNPSIMYASIHGDGIYKTAKGQTASEGEWTKLNAPVNITGATGQDFTIDVFWGSPQMLYAALNNPKADLELGLYRTNNNGGLWETLEYKKNTLGGLYNPFIRVRPNNKDIIYFGGVKLYKKQWNVKGETLINDIHDDMHGFEFDPFSPDHFYVTGDGGIFRCKFTSGINTSDSCIHRNYDLRVTQFYDFDAASNNSNLMLGGTQDNGTLLYEGNLDWRMVRGGDGLYSVIAPKNNAVMYSQYQSLDSTIRSDDSGQTWKPAGNGLPKNFVMENSYISVHPNSPDYVLAQGDQVYFTQDGGNNWAPKGPVGSNVKGNITRVVVQPTLFTWVAGNDHGQIWYTSTGGSPWRLLFEHPNNASVRSLAFSPADHHVLYAIFNGGQDYMRVWRFKLNPGQPANWSISNITDNFPSEREPRVISGDGYSADIAYLGTDKGIYRWKDGKPTYASWGTFNEGLPLVRVNDLLVDPSSKQLRAATFGRGAWTVDTNPCTWVPIERAGQNSHQPTQLCSNGSFLTALDLDGDRNISGHDAPVIGQALCCDPAGDEDLNWESSWVGVEQVGYNSHGTDGDWCPQGHFITGIDLDTCSNCDAMDSPVIGKIQCSKLKGYNSWGSSYWVEVGAQKSHQTGSGWCTDGGFITQMDLDRAAGADPHDSPIIGRVKCSSMK